MLLKKIYNDFIPKRQNKYWIRYINKRDDGYHNISSVFYPVMSLLIFLRLKNQMILFLHLQNKKIDNNNICVKAFNLFKITLVFLMSIYIYISGFLFVQDLGGGSSDASFTLKMLNDLFNLKISNSIKVLCFNDWCRLSFFYRK